MTIRIKREKRGSIKAPCAECGREIATRVPPGGDGTERHPRKHSRPDGKPCIGHRRPAVGWD